MMLMMMMPLPACTDIARYTEEIDCIIHIPCMQIVLLPKPSVMYLDDEKTEGVIDWENPAAARALTQTLLAHDFGLQWDIPIERLCPPVSKHQ